MRLLFGLFVLMIFIVGCSESPSENVEPATIQKTELTGCDAFGDKLDGCEPFSCEFKHPFGGQMMKKKIIGLVDGACQYTEEMPNNGQMDCTLSEDMRKAIAQYHRDVAKAQSGTVEMRTNLDSGETQTTYTVDGKEVDNPLQEAMNNGDCVVSGYS